MERLDKAQIDNEEDNLSTPSDEEKRKKKKSRKRKKDKEKKKRGKDSEDSDDSEKEKQLKEKKEKKNPADIIVGNFVILTEVGKGAFGQIFLSYSVRDDCEVAIKKEIKKLGKTSSPQLKMEYLVYKSILNIQTVKDVPLDVTGATPIITTEVQGFPRFYGYGETSEFYYLIMEFLGPNLIDLFNYCNMRKFTISTVCLIAIQMLNRLEYMHKHHFLHRDIKPENFAIGCDDKSNVIYLIDYGLSKKYKDPKTHQHIPYREGRPLTGTARYVSINTHLGIEQSRRDDLESVGYVLVFFLKGSLPWQGLKNINDRYNRIMEKKLQIPTEILCFGLPDEISHYLNYCKSLRYEDRPDYDYLRGLFIKLISTCGSVYGITREHLKFDWCFEDPSIIWQVYSKKKAVTVKKKDESSNDINSPANRNTSNQNLPNQMDKKKQTFYSMSKIEEITPGQEDARSEKDNNEEKTNEHNPDIVIISNHGSSVDIGYNSMLSDKSDDTIEVKAKNTTQLNPNILQKIDQKELEKIFTLNLVEDVDFYINKIFSNKNMTDNENNKKNNNSLPEFKKIGPLTNLITTEKIRSSNTKQSIKENSENNSDATIEYKDPLKAVQKDILYKIHSKVENESSENSAFNIFGKSKDEKDEEPNANLIKSPEFRKQPSVKSKKATSPDTGSRRASAIFKEIDNTVITHDKKKKSTLNELKLYDISINNSTITSNVKPRSGELIQPNRKTSISASSSNLIKTNKNNLLTNSLDNKLILPKPLESFSNLGTNKSFEEEVKSKNLEKAKVDPSNLKFSKESMIKISNEPVSKYYTIEGDLGHGSYGQVKRVKHKQLQEDRAMKIVKKRSESSQNEIDILKKISHPNIISIYEIFEDSKSFYIMSELLEGGELFEVITSNGSFHESDSARIMRQILDAVNYLHNQNIMHRDLKPENILIVNRNSNISQFEIKIIDFGTARQFEKNQKLTKFIGTSYYIAPEVLLECYDEKCDVWSCGVILYILLCGYPPFNGSSNLDIYHAIKHSNVVFPGEEWKDVSKEAVDLIKQMLNKSPLRRPSAASCLNHKWFDKFEALEESSPTRKKNLMNTTKALKKMEKFVAENKLKQAVLQFITTQFNIKNEEDGLKQIFKQFDSENKGVISVENFHNVITKFYGENDAKFFTEKVFSNIDMDGSGQISYNEFLTAIVDDRSFLTKERLLKAFKMFDKDGNGKISIDEIRSIFGGDREKWEKIVKEVDQNGDGEIDFEEFKVMMSSMDEKILQ